MALKPLKYSLKHVAMALLLHNAAAGVGTALPPYKHRRGFFARGGGFAIGNTGPSEEIEALAGESFDWLANLGAPAALEACCRGFWDASRRTLRAAWERYQRNGAAPTASGRQRGPSRTPSTRRAHE